LESASGPPFELHEPPPGLITTPYDRVKALMDSPDDVVAAIDELVEAGFERDQIFVLCGPRGAERLDVSGRHHGLAGRVYRVVEKLGDVQDALRLSADHMNAGGFWLLVPADDADKVTVAGILGNHGAHDMVHYGRYHHERLGS
jgi:hypothetical protein